MAASYRFDVTTIFGPAPPGAHPGASPPLPILRQQQRIYSDQYAHYRRCQPWDQQTRQPIWSQFALPRPGQWPGLQQAPAPPLSVPTAGAAYNYVPPNVPNRIMPNTMPGKVNSFAGGLDMHSVNFVKLLNWGGQGIVAIFDARNKKGENPLFLVAKNINPPALPPARRAMQRESRFLKVRAVQLITLVEGDCGLTATMEAILCSRCAYCSSTSSAGRKPEKIGEECPWTALGNRPYPYPRSASRIPAPG
jgi:hypothetical protein